jgi:hypothetical protein
MNIHFASSHAVPAISYVLVIAGIVFFVAAFVILTSWVYRMKGRKYAKRVLYSGMIAGFAFVLVGALTGVHSAGVANDKLASTFQHSIAKTYGVYLSEDAVTKLFYADNSVQGDNSAVTIDTVNNMGIMPRTFGHADVLQNGSFERVILATVNGKYIMLKNGTELTELPRR